MIGKAIGTYKILRELGSGPHGTVYEAADQARGQIVALKALRPELTRQAAFKQNLRAVSARLAQLQHPHLANFYTILQVGNDLYLVTEFINGQPLNQALQQSGVLASEQAVRLAIQALDALAFAHAEGFVHGGVRPNNLLLTPEGALKLTDLGLAQAALPQPVELGLGTAVLNYVAPEQVHGEVSDARADVYALGAVLYEMITGLPPFRRANNSALLKAQLEETPPSPRQYFPLISDLLEAILLRALAKAPEQRFQSAAEFRAALLSWRPAAAEPETTPTINVPAFVPPPPVDLTATAHAAPLATPPVAPVTAPPAALVTAPQTKLDTSPLPLQPQSWPQFAPDNPTVGGPANLNSAPTLRELANNDPTLHNQVFVELEETPAARRSFWKPLAIVTGVATLLGASYAAVRLNQRPASSSTPIIVKLSPTPAVLAPPPVDAPEPVATSVAPTLAPTLETASSTPTAPTPTASPAKAPSPKTAATARPVPAPANAAPRKPGAAKPNAAAAKPAAKTPPVTAGKPKPGTLPPGKPTAGKNTPPINKPNPAAPGKKPLATPPPASPAAPAKDKKELKGKKGKKKDENGLPGATKSDKKAKDKKPY